ncbi:unnamed protein product [Closterium sp. Naga37s-1]|nr:unnamed protein product [Closterium sp. Naga37s-1]
MPVISLLSPLRAASSRLSARPPLVSPRGLLSPLRAASSHLSARPPLASPRRLLSPPRAASSRLSARPPLASSRHSARPPLASPRGLLSPLRAASSRLPARPPLASPRGLLSPPFALATPSHRHRFPLPSPSLPPPIALASPSHRPRFPLPSPSLPPPIALASPSHRPRFPLPSPSLPPPFALASPSHRHRFPLPSPLLPPPVALASPSRRPRFPRPSLVHLRHLSAWGSSTTNASSSHLLAFLFPLSPPNPHPLFPCSCWFTCAICQCGAAASPTPLRRCSLFPHSHHPLSTPASPPSPAVARSLAPSVSVGQQHHQRLCAAAPLPPLPPSSFHPRLSPFPCSRSFTCAICQCGAAASPTPLRRCSLFPHSHHPLSTPASPPSPAVARSLAPSVSVGQQHHQRLCAAAPFSPTPTILFPPPPLPLRLQSLVHLRHLSVWGSSITNASAPLLPFPHSHHPLSTPASPPSPAVARSLAPSVSVGQQHHQRLCAAAPFSPTPTILFPPPPLPLRLQSLVHLRHLSVWGSSITNASAPLLPFPHSHHPLSTPASPPSPAVARSLAPSVSVGQQHHQRLCLAAPRLPPPALRQPRLDCPLPPPRPPLPHRPPPLPLPPAFHWLPSPLLLILSLRLLSFLLSLLLLFLLPPHSSGSLWCLNRSSLLPLPSSPPRLPHSPHLDPSTAAVPDALLLHLAHSLPHTVR